MTDIPDDIMKAKNTHLMEWLPQGYDHCQRGSRDWCQGYLNSAHEYIAALERALLTEREASSAKVGELQDEIDEINGIWPDWADKSLKMVREVSGYDGYDDRYDGVDLPAELEEVISDLKLEVGDANDKCSVAEAALQLEQAKATRYRKACNAAGVCMSCIDGAPENFGCWDCQNTGWSGGDPHARATAAEAARAEAVAALTVFAEMGDRILAEAPPEAMYFIAMQSVDGSPVQVSLSYLRQARAIVAKYGDTPTMCPSVGEPHSDDLAVDRFFAAMKAKLAKKRDDGYSGWDDSDDCSVEHLSYLLVQHLHKGDPIDIANFAMMLHQRGSRLIVDEETAAISKLSPTTNTPSPNLKTEAK